MKRLTKLVLGVAVILFLSGVMATTVTTSKTKVTPADIQTGEYAGETVTVEGLITSEVVIQSHVTFELGGNESMANESGAMSGLDLESLTSVTVIYDGDRLPTLEKGRIVIVEGTVTNEGVVADTIKVQAHRSSGQ